MTRGRRAREGDIVEIALGDGSRSLARVLVEPLLEFFDVRLTSSEQIAVEEVAAAPVAFRIWVMNRALAGGRWPVIGSAPLSEDERRRTERFFKQDPIYGRLTIYWETQIQEKHKRHPRRSRNASVSSVLPYGIQSMLRIDYATTSLAGPTSGLSRSARIRRSKRPALSPR